MSNDELGGKFVPVSVGHFHGLAWRQMGDCELSEIHFLLRSMASLQHPSLVSTWHSVLIHHFGAN